MGRRGGLGSSTGWGGRPGFVDVGAGGARFVVAAGGAGFVVTGKVGGLGSSTGWGVGGWRWVL
ncbi:hypothetical protein TIFTF001_029816 [Ficus carica]|uniref:Uncharacterized protein n=1 Tax=Ficus carica TaxID=3494 RepID=A0AA88DS41_FICCA|nr:hypothetical protein TIFTF001_029816 [Ficus carica]